MNKQVIEHAGIPVGIVIPDGDALKFIAVKFPVIDLDGVRYRDADEAKAAIRRHIETRPVAAV
jgi:hypothetical protein